MKNQLLILKKIKFKLKQVAVNLLIKISLLYKWPKLTAIAFWLASSKNNPKCQSQYLVLCMGRTVFADDVTAMAAHSGKIRYITIWRTYFQNIFQYFCEGEEIEKITEGNYHTHDFCKQGKQKYYSYMRRMFPWLHKIIGFDAVLCGNIGYPDQQEIEKICVEEKTPYIVLQKEGLTAGVYEDSADLYKGCKFIGARMLVYNEKVIDALVGINRVSGLSRDKVKAVGVPRLDCYFKEVGKPAKKQIVFFSFYTKHRFPRIITNSEKLLQAERRTEDFHKWVMNFARNYPNYKVIIKTKAAGFYLDYVLDIYKNNFKEKISNLVITSTADSIELIKNSIAVLGFSSMTLMEGIIAGKIAISPYFGDLVDGQCWDYFDDYPELINYVKTEAELEERIFNREKYLNYDPKRKENFLTFYISTPDGNASVRTEEAIIEAINEYKSK